MKRSHIRKRERDRSLSRVGLRQENPRDGEAYHNGMILPSAKVFSMATYNYLGMRLCIALLLVAN
jgi:hypothetical protein